MILLVYIQYFLSEIRRFDITHYLKEIICSKFIKFNYQFKLFCTDRVIQPMKVLQKSGYTLKVRSQRVSLQPQDPEFFVNDYSTTVLFSPQESQKFTHAMFLVEVLENERNSQPSEFKMQLSIHEKN